MKIILWPVTAVALICFGVLLGFAALAATICSLLASASAFAIIKLLAFQKSPLLLELMSLLGTDTEESKIQHTKEAK